MHVFSVLYITCVVHLCVSVLIRIGDKSEKKPVFQVEIVPEVQLIALISGELLCFLFIVSVSDSHLPVYWKSRQHVQKKRKGRITHV